MNVQDEIKALKQRIAELEEQNKYELFPQEGDDYCYTTMLGRVCHGSWDNLDSETKMLELGNIYRTEEEAEFDVEKKKVETELLKFSIPVNPTGGNYFIVFNMQTGVLGTRYSFYITTQGAIYFESEEKALQAIDSIGEERIKKYIFGVED